MFEFKLLDTSWGCIFVWCRTLVYQSFDSSAWIKGKSSQWHCDYQFTEGKQLFKCHGVSFDGKNCTYFFFVFLCVSSFDISPPLFENPNSYHVYIDENGDAAGNYTILALKKDHRRDSNLSMAYGLYPIGTFVLPDSNQIPVSIFSIDRHSFTNTHSFIHTHT